MVVNTYHIMKILVYLVKCTQFFLISKHLSVDSTFVMLGLSIQEESRVEGSSCGHSSSLQRLGVGSFTWCGGKQSGRFCHMQYFNVLSYSLNDSLLRIFMSKSFIWIPWNDTWKTTIVLFAYILWNHLDKCFSNLIKCILVQSTVLIK